MKLPMKCLDNAQLFWYRHGELSARERREVAWHLAMCPECRKRYADKTRLAVGLARNLVLPGKAARAFPAPDVFPTRGFIGLTCVVVIALSFLRVYSVASPPQSMASPSPSAGCSSCHSAAFLRAGHPGFVRPTFTNVPAHCPAHKENLCP